MKKCIKCDSFGIVNNKLLVTNYLLLYLWRGWILAYHVELSLRSSVFNLLVKIYSSIYFVKFIKNDSFCISIYLNHALKIHILHSALISSPYMNWTSWSRYDTAVFRAVIFNGRRISWNIKVSVSFEGCDLMRLKPYSENSFNSKNNSEFI